MNLHSGNGLMDGTRRLVATATAPAVSPVKENLSSKVSGITPEEVVRSPNFVLVEGVLVGAVTITPAMAEEWLKRNVANIRNPKRPSIGEYSESMKKGQWDFNGDPIRFDKDGNLVDGQNRLYSCVESGKPFTTTVIYGIESSDNIDGGRKRTLAELLGSKGFASQAQVSTLVNGVHNFRAKSGTSFSQVGHGEKVLTKKDALAFAQQNMDEINRAVHNTKKTKNLFGRQGTHATLYFLFSETAGDSMAESFYSQLISGASLGNSNPILHLRNRLQAHTNNKNEKMTDNAYAGLVIKCWNSWIAGQDMLRLSYNYDKEKIAKIRRSPVK